MRRFRVLESDALSGLSDGSAAMVWLRLTSQPGVWRTRLAFLTRCEVPSGTFLTPVGVCLVSPFVPPTMLLGRRGPRRIAPGAARAAQPPIAG